MPIDYHGRTMTQLRERIDQLETVIGFNRKATAQVADAFPKMEPALAEILSMLLKRDFVTRDGLYTVLYGARADVDMPDEKVMDTQICRLRAHLKKHDVTFETAKDSGWFMPKPQKARVRALIESAPLPDLEAVARAEEQKRKRQARHDFLWE
jgi:DNA-binding response OmpR family regulator